MSAPLRGSLPRIAAVGVVAPLIAFASVSPAVGLAGRTTGTQPVTATVSLSSPQVEYGAKVLVTGTASSTGLSGTAPASGVQAQLLRRGPGQAGWHRVGEEKTTGPKGAVHWSVVATSNSAYEVLFHSTPVYASTTTPAANLLVAAKVHLRAISTAPELTKSSIVGTIHPSRTGKVELQSEVSGAWKNVHSAEPSDGKFSFTISPKSYKTLHYRVVAAQTAQHVASTSRTLHITVVHRTLVYGNSGHDVLALWKRLKQLHYDVGPKTSTYGWDLVHAVTAFEKVQGITKDGDASETVWKKLNHPKVPHLKHPVATGYAVEVNIEKQILLISKNGQIWRILDTSTAGGYLYTDSEGQTERAITPRGHFTFQYKRTGTVVSKLGTLYYPSYFNDSGYAIHGEGDGNDGGEVPPYANSHGCVRITDNAVLRYYYKVFTVGTSVWIY